MQCIPSATLPLSRWRRIDWTGFLRSLLPGLAACLLAMAATTAQAQNPQLGGAIDGNFGYTPNSRASGIVTLIVTQSAPALVSESLPSGDLLMPYRAELDAGRGVTKFNVAGLPREPKYDATTGVISGIPAQAGTFPVKVAAVNPSGTSAIGELLLTIDPINPQVVGTFEGVLDYSSPFTGCALPSPSG